MSPGTNAVMLFAGAYLSLTSFLREKFFIILTVFKLLNYNHFDINLHQKCMLWTVFSLLCSKHRDALIITEKGNVAEMLLGDPGVNCLSASSL